MQWEKKNLTNKWSWQNWITTCRRMKLDPHLSTYVKKQNQKNLKWTKDINLKPKTETTRSKQGALFKILVQARILCSSTRASPKRQQIGQPEIKTFLHSQRNCQPHKTDSQQSGRKSSPATLQNLQRSETSKKQNCLSMKELVKETVQCSKEDTRMANKYLHMLPKPLDTGEMQLF